MSTPRSRACSAQRGRMNNHTDRALGEAPRCGQVDPGRAELADSVNVQCGLVGNDRFLSSPQRPANQVVVCAHRPHEKPVYATIDSHPVEFPLLAGHFHSERVSSPTMGLRAGKESCWEGNDRGGGSRMSSSETRWRSSAALASRYARSPTSWGSTTRPWVMAITEVPQSRSAKFPTLGVLVSLAGVSFRSVFSGLGLVGA